MVPLMWHVQDKSSSHDQEPNPQLNSVHRAPGKDTRKHDCYVSTETACPWVITNNNKPSAVHCF